MDEIGGRRSVYLVVEPVMILMAVTNTALYILFYIDFMFLTSWAMWDVRLMEMLSLCGDTPIHEERNQLRGRGLAFGKGLVWFGY